MNNFLSDERNKEIIEIYLRIFRSFAHKYGCNVNIDTGEFIGPDEIKEKVSRKMTELFSTDIN